tara:strand:- start:179 stop:412 length:234 start_codon:yes stop_codon:yes gene_type:complete
MIIPIKCFTCGTVLANKYRYYQDEVRKIKIDKNLEDKKIEYLTSNVKNKTPEGEVLDRLNLNKYCCRRHMLTHVDIN